jgi:hypothetical protein
MRDALNATGRPIFIAIRGKLILTCLHLMSCVSRMGF